jgi:hypothetical protein
MDIDCRSSFHESLIDAVAEVRRRLAEADISSVCLDIEVRGRALSGNLELVYKLSLDSYGSSVVRGFDLEAVISEFLRRQGWQDNNQPLMLPAA